MRIAELYDSIQGEGLLTGTRSVFVRASGCNLRCHFCDTPHASWYPEGEDLSVEEIVQQVLQWPTEHVVLTGGEPMLFAELVPICERLRQQGRHLTIETAGTLYLPVECDLMSISPKLSNSLPMGNASPRSRERHERTRRSLPIVRRLWADYVCQLKFVVGTLEDAEEAIDYLDAIPALDRSRVMLMPLGTDAEELTLQARWLEPLCQEHGLRYCPRKQIEWFGAVRGT